MMTRELQVSVLAAPLAAIDRRMLSQAWYSALRLAQQPIARNGSLRPVAPSPQRRGARGPQVRRERSNTPRLPASKPLPAFQRRSVRTIVDRDESLPRLKLTTRRPLARAIEEAFCTPSDALRRATFSVGRRGARVHVLLQTRGGVSALVALCSPAVSRQVSRALAEARLCLAARGVVADLCLREGIRMFLNSAMSAALDRIAERAADARRAFTPGALPGHDDVATDVPMSDFTLDPLSVSAPAGAYFITRDERGEVAYTRDGTFTLSAGRLVDQRGRSVCGLHAGSEVPVELRADPIDTALGRVMSAHIEPDGSLVYRRKTIDPRTASGYSQRIVVGRLALARFPAGTKLENSDGIDVTPPHGIIPHVGLPKDGSFEAVAPMQRDRSRIDIDLSLIRLKEAYLAFDALRAAETAKAHLGKTALDLVK